MSGRDLVDDEQSESEPIVTIPRVRPVALDRIEDHEQKVAWNRARVRNLDD